MPTYTHIQGTGNTAASGGGSNALSAKFASPVTIGNLVIVGVTGYSNSYPTVSDSAGNTYTALPQADISQLYAEIFYTVATTGGTITVTVSADNYTAMAIDEFSFSAGNLIAPDGHAGATGVGLSAATGNITPTGSDLFYGLVAHSGSAGFMTPGSGFTGTYSQDGSGGTYIPILAEYQFGVSSATPVTGTLPGSNNWAIVGAAFLASVPAIFVTPAVIPANHSGHLTITLTGTGTSWVSGTTVFTASGGGVTIVSQNITSTTAATIVVTTGGTTGTCTLSDGTHTGILTTRTATIAVNPPGFAQSVTTPVTVTGVNTLWLAETASGLFSAAGIAGLSVASVVVTNNTTATFALTTGSATGAITITDNSTTATAAATVYNNTPGITPSPSFVPWGRDNVVIGLIGTDTNWVSGTTVFTLSGIAGVVLNSQTITSTTAATLNINVGTLVTITAGNVVAGTAIGPVTVSDGSYSATFNVVGPSVSQAYVSRNGQMAYFLTTGPDITFPTAIVPGVPTYGVVGTTVGSGGSGYSSSPTAAISGSLVLTLTNSGYNYTSAPTVTLTGGGGTGASATAAINSGVGIVLATAGSGYSTAPTVAFSGGGGSGAAATAHISGGVVTGFTLTNQGSGYASIPTVALSGGGFSVAATATAYLAGGAVSGLTVVPGSGYTSPPTVAFSGGGVGLGATAVATILSGGGAGAVLGAPVVSGGVIESVPIVYPGSGYTSGPTIVVTDSSGTGATVSAVLGGVTVEITAVNAQPTIDVNGHAVNLAMYGGSIPVATAGSGYASVPAVTITGGSGTAMTATASITSANGVSLSLTSGGSGYTSPPIVSFSAGGNGQVAATAFINAAGSVIGFAVSPGGGYTTAPTVTFTGGGGTGCAATVSSAAGCVCSIAVDNPGWGYLASDTVAATVAAGGGTTATAAVVIGPVWAASSLQWPFVPYQMLCGGVQSIVVQNGGTGYTSAPTVTPSGGGGSGFTVGAVTLVSGVIAAIAVTSPGTGYTSQPTLTIAGGSGSGAVAVAMMSGPAPTDAVTFSAPVGWLCTTAGPVPASSAAPMMNFAGAIEPMFSGVVPSTMKIGTGKGTPNGAGEGSETQQNWIKGTLTPWYGAVAPAVTFARTGGDVTGANALAHCVVNSSGVVTSVVVDCGGSAYTATPTVTIAAPPSGTRATATATVVSGIVTAITLGSPGNGGTGYGGSAADGHPIAINGTVNAADGGTGGYPSCYAVIANNANGLVIAGGSWPDPAGYWTFVADESAPGSPMTVSLYSINAAGARTLVPLVGGYPTGTGTGKTWLWDVIRPTATTEGLNIQLNVEGPAITSTAPWTLSNEYMTSPIRGTGAAQTPNRSVNNAPNQNIVNYLTTSGGNCAFARLGPFSNWEAGDSNIVDVADLQSVSAFSYNGGPNSQIVCVGIRRYQIWSGSPGYFSPYVWTNQAYPGTAVVGGGPWPNAWTPPNNGSSNSVHWLANVATNTGTVGAEIVTAAAHGLKTGQLVQFGSSYLPFTGTLTAGSPVVTTIASTAGLAPNQVVYWTGGTSTNVLPAWTYIVSVDSGTQVTLSQDALVTGSKNLEASLTSFLVDNVNGSGTVVGDLAGYFTPAWVTGPTTFAIGIDDYLPTAFSAAYNTIIIGLNVSNIDAANAAIVYNFPATLPVSFGEAALPYEVLAGLVAAIPNCGLHTFIPAMATDACVTTIATAIRDTIPLGRPVILEFMDEAWNSGYPHTNTMFLLASLASGALGIAAYASQSFFAARQSQIHDIAVAVFNATDINGNTNRGGSIVRAFGSQYGNSNVAGNIVAYANTFNATSPANPMRIDLIMIAPYLDMDPNATDALVVAAAASTYSNYAASIQYESTTPWTMGMYVDLYRHNARYNPVIVGNTTSNFGALKGSSSPPPFAYNLVPGQTVAPAIMAYEGALQYPVSTGVSLASSTLRPSIAYDLFYHPFMYDCQSAYYAGLQQAGYSLLQANELLYAFGAGGSFDAYGVAVWLYMGWEGQTWGKGDGSVDGNGNLTTNQFFNGTNTTYNITNVSPKFQSWRDWAAVANVVPSVSSFTLSASSGAFALTGMAATLTSSATIMSASEGAFSLTGESATLLAAGSLPASEGVFALTGVAATLTPSGAAMAASEGAFVLTGKSASLTSSGTLSASEGVFSLAGIAAMLTPSAAMSAAKGIFSLLGKPATLGSTATPQTRRPKWYSGMRRGNRY